MDLSSDATAGRVPRSRTRSEGATRCTRCYARPGIARARPDSTSAEWLAAIHDLVGANSADDWLHIAFAVTMIGGGLLLGRRERRELQTA